MLRVGVLGPLEVVLAGQPVRLASGRLRALLVVMAMAGGSPLPVDRLATALWDDEPPDHIRRVVQTYLGRLRRELDAGLIVTEPAGYRLCIDPEQVDALRFTRLLDTAAKAPDPAAERSRLAEALALWRGDPFDGVPSDWLARSEAPRLVERYLAALERRIDLDLADRPSGELVAQLQELTARHPLRESLWVRLIGALDRSGRQAEALAQYETIRRRLATELGTDPGQQLRDMYARLLTGHRPPPAPAATTLPVVPRQLPADIDGFTGRTEALEALNTLAGQRHRRPAAVLVTAIAGTAGVGKTALAVHWAHQVADRFPDGQLYLNLRGFHPTGPAMPPTEAIRSLLVALDIPPTHIPADLDAQIGLYRSRLAGKHILILLDNARDADQVRPLLPGSSTCLVLITSRHQLTSLIATQAAQPLVLDLLPHHEARQLLAHRLGPDRTTAEPAATDEIITYCARLPLALAIAAAHAAIRPDFPLATLATQLHHQSTRLDTLTSGDPTTDARTVFSWSYQALTPPAAQLFRQLALHPGPHITTPAAASLIAQPTTHTRTLLTELTTAHLLTEPVPGQYTLHDLLRTYAAELVKTQENPAQQHAAQHRLLDHYLHTGYTATMRQAPHRDPIELPAVRAGVSPEPLDDAGQAATWFTAERSVLLAAIEQAYRTGFDFHAWQLAWTVMGFLDRRGEWDDLTAALHIALAAANRLGDPVGQAITHRNLAVSAAMRSRYEESGHHLRQALGLFQRLGDLTNQATTRLGLAQLAGQLGNNAGALDHTRSALDTYRAIGHRDGEAAALNRIGWYHAHLGDHELALAHCQRALDMLRELGDRREEAGTLDTIGFAHHNLGNHRESAAYHEAAFALYDELGESYYAAGTLVHLGDAQLAAGDPGSARAAWQRALVIFDELDHPDAADVRTRLGINPSSD